LFGKYGVDFSNKLLLLGDQGDLEKIARLATKGIPSDAMNHFGPVIGRPEKPVRVRFTLPPPVPHNSGTVSTPSRPTSTAYA
jgi:hypothetical protein